VCLLWFFCVFVVVVLSVDVTAHTCKHESFVLNICVQGVPSCILSHRFVLVVI